MKAARPLKAEAAPARVRPPSLAVRQAFAAQYGPKPGEAGKSSDAELTLLRLRRRTPAPGADTMALTIGPRLKARLTAEAKRRRRTPERFAAELISQILDDLEDERIVRQRLKKPGRIYAAAQIERELGL